MSYQLIRGTFESRTAQALINAGLSSDHIYWDNVGETPPTSGAYATISMSFTDTIVDTIHCEGLEDLRGSLSVNVYTAKNQGSKEGEDICLEVIKAWLAINTFKAQPTDQILSMKTRSIEGPFTIAPSTQSEQQQAKHVNNVACSWMARAA